MLSKKLLYDFQSTSRNVTVVITNKLTTESPQKNLCTEKIRSLTGRETPREAGGEPIREINAQSAQSIYGRRSRYTIPFLVEAAVSYSPVLLHFDTT
jgi:hypothetical protein